MGNRSAVAGYQRTDFKGASPLCGVVPLVACPYFSCDFLEAFFVPL